MCAAVGRGRDQRGARSGSRRQRRSDAAFPNEDAHLVRRVDLGEFDVGVFGKHLMPLEGRAEPQEPLVGRQLPQYHALRVAEVHDDGLERLAGGDDRDLPEIARQSHRGAKRRPPLPRADARQPFGSRRRLNREFRLGMVQQRPKAPHAVAGHLGRAAVGIEELHRRAAGRRRVHDQAVCANAGVPITDLAGEPIERDVRHGGLLDVEEIVAVGVGFDEAHAEVICDRMRADASPTDGRSDAAGR